MSQYRNTVFLSGITSGLVYRMFGMEYIFPDYENKITNNSNIVGQVGRYLECEFHLTNWPGSIDVRGHAGFQEAQYFLDEPIRIQDKKFLIISQEEFESSKWWPWTKFLEPARIQGDAIDPDPSIPGGFTPIIHSARFISEEEANYGNPQYNENREIGYRIVVDKPVYDTFDTWDDCYNAFFDIGEKFKEKFDNSYSSHSINYTIEIITGQTLLSYDFGDLDGWGFFQAPFVALKNRYEPEGLYSHTGDHFAILIINGFGLFTGYGNEYTPWHTMDLNFYIYRDPTLSLDEYYAAVMLHELGHNLGLDHSFTNLQRGWSKLYPDLTVDGLDNLSRFGSQLSVTFGPGDQGEGISGSTWNDGNLIISYSGESPGAAAIMSYQLDPAPAFHCPFNVNKLVDSDSDYYSGATFHQDYPFNTKPLDCLFINRGVADYWDQSIDSPFGNQWSSIFTSLNLNLIGYITGDTEFVKGEITEINVRMTGRTSLEKYKQPEYWWNSEISDEDEWIEGSLRQILMFNNNSGTTEQIYFKTQFSPIEAPGNIEEGKLDEYTFNISGSQFTEVENKILGNYDNLTQAGIRIVYFGNSEANRTVWEIVDLQMDLVTTGGTITRKATDYNNYFTGDTEGNYSKVSHVGVTLNFNTGFTRNEANATIPALRTMDYLFSLDDPIENPGEEVSTLGPRYMVCLNEEERHFVSYDMNNEFEKLLTEPPPIGERSGQWYNFNINSFKIQDGYAYLLGGSYRDPETNSYVTNPDYVERFFGKYEIISEHPFLIDYNPTWVYQLLITGSTSTIGTSTQNNFISDFSILDTNLFAFSELSYLDNGFFSASTVDGTSILQTINFGDDDYFAPGDYGSVKKFEKFETETPDDRFILLGGDKNEGPLFIRQYEPNFLDENITSVLNIISNNQVFYDFFYSNGTINSTSDSIQRFFYRDWGDGLRLNLISSKGKLIRFDGYELSDNSYLSNAQNIVHTFDEYNSDVDSRRYHWSAISKTDDPSIKFGGGQVYLSGVNSNLIYSLNLYDYTGNTFSVGDYVTGFTYTQGQYMTDLVYVDNNPVANSEIYYHVIDPKEYTATGYGIYYSNDIELPTFSGDNSNPNTPYGLISYNFNIVDDDLDFSIENFTGEVKVMIFVYHDDDFYFGELEGIQLIASTIEDIENLDPNLNFTVKCDIELVGPDHELRNGYSVNWTMYDFADMMTNTYGSVYSYNGYHYGIFVDFMSFGGAGIAQALGIYSAVVRTSNTEAVRTTYIHELGHCWGLWHSFSTKWQSVFSDLKYKCLDQSHERPFTYWGETTEDILNQDRSNFSYIDEWVGTPYEKNTTIMGYKKFEYESVQGPLYAQSQLDEKIWDVQDSYGDGPATSIQGEGNVTFIDWGDDISIDNLESIRINFRRYYYSQFWNATGKIVNTGSTESYTFYTGQDESQPSVSTVMIEKSDFENIWNENDKLSFGLELKKVVNPTYNVDTQYNNWQIQPKTIKIEFFMTDGSIIVRSPKDCFTTTNLGNRLNIYTATTKRSEIFSSYERLIIENNFTYRWKNYLI